MSYGRSTKKERLFQQNNEKENHSQRVFTTPIGNMMNITKEEEVLFAEAKESR